MGYKNEALELFLRRVWQLANQYETKGNKRKEMRLRAFYNSKLREYRAKKHLNKYNYINL